MLRESLHWFYMLTHQTPCRFPLVDILVKITVVLLVVKQLIKQELVMIIVRKQPYWGNRSNHNEKNFLSSSCQPSLISSHFFFIGYLFQCPLFYTVFPDYNGKVRVCFINNLGYNKTFTTRFLVIQLSYDQRWSTFDIFEHFWLWLDNSV